ncbi:enoyl-CoA hydratase-related protein [Streptomyces hirsutus]
MADTVLYEVSDGLATITLNRPEAMNALNVAAKVALRDAVRAAADDEGVRAVLLTAAGDRAFCVGQDLKEHIGLLVANRRTVAGAR